jgi:MFS family permease
LVISSRADTSSRLAVLSLLFARVIYAVNWFNIASIFPHIASDFRQDVFLLGLLSSSFLIGIGLFQIPGGIIAAVQGPRKTAIYGITIASSAVFLCGLSQIYQMEILRFVVGVGMALFFGPSVTLITRYLGKGSEGLAVGLLNSAHSIGGIIGLFGWVVIADSIGWRQSLLLSGGLGLISSLLLITFLPTKEKEQVKEPEQKKNKHLKLKLSDIKNVLLDKSLFLFGLVLLGAQIAWGLPLTYIVFYLVDYLKVSSVVAGFVASLILICGLLFAPIFGKIYDKTRNTKKLLFVCGVAMSAGLTCNAITSTSTEYIIVISNIIVGVFSAGVFTIAYASARATRINLNTNAAMENREKIQTRVTNRSTINQTHYSYETMNVSWVNGLSLFGAFWVPFIFSFVVHHLGYAIAWLFGGLLSFLFILPSLCIKAYKIP